MAANAGSHHSHRRLPSNLHLIEGYNSDDRWRLWSRNGTLAASGRVRYLDLYDSHRWFLSQSSLAVIKFTSNRRLQFRHTLKILAGPAALWGLVISLRNCIFDKVTRKHNSGDDGDNHLWCPPISSIIYTFTILVWIVLFLEYIRLFNPR